MFWRGVVGYLPANVAQGVAGLLAIVAFTRLLTPAEYGAYALGFSVMSLGHTLTFTWLEAAMARFQARSAAQGTQADLMTTLYRCWAGAALIYPAVAGIGLWLLPAPREVKLAMAAGLASTLARSLAKLVQERRRAAGDVRAVALLDMTQSLGGLAASVALIVMGWAGAGAVAGSGVIAAVALAFVLPVELRGLKGGRFDGAAAKGYASYGLPVAASLILSLALATTDRFIISAYLGDGAVGVYHAGYSLSNRTLDILFIWLGMAGGPALVAALERGGSEAMHEAAREQSNLMIALTLPAAVGLALVARPLCDVMVGPALRDGAGAVTPWIAASGFFSGITTYYFHQAFTLAPKTRLLLPTMAIPVVLNLVLTVVLIPRFGLSGAMWATTASYGLGAIASAGLGRRAIALPFPWRPFLTAGAASLVMAAAVISLPAIGGALELALKAGVGALVYAAVAAALDVGHLRSRGWQLVASARARAMA